MASFKDLKVTEEEEKKLAAAAANPVGAELLDLIAQTASAVELHRIAEQIISDLPGINEEERDGLLEAVHFQFCVINAAAMQATPKPRWDKL